MPEDLFVIITRTVQVQENAGVTPRLITIRPGSTTETPLVAIELWPKNEDGSWMEDAQPLVFQIEGQIATDFQQLAFTAPIQEGELAAAADVVGQTVWEGMKGVISLLKQQQEEQQQQEQEEQP